MILDKGMHLSEPQCPRHKTGIMGPTYYRDVCGNREKSRLLPTWCWWGRREGGYGPVGWARGVDSIETDHKLQAETLQRNPDLSTLPSYLRSHHLLPKGAATLLQSLLSASLKTRVYTFR